MGGLVNDEAKDPLQPLWLAFVVRGAKTHNAVQSRSEAMSLPHGGLDRPGRAGGECCTLRGVFAQRLRGKIPDHAHVEGHEWRRCTLRCERSLKS